MQKNKKLVVGGYGDVGRRICLELVEHYPGRVIAAGRSIEKAQQFATSTGRKVLSRQINIGYDVPNELLQDVLLVIMVVDIPKIKFVRQCFEHKVHYIDITATYELIQQIKSLGGVAIENGVTGIVSVGLDPGLSNLLAKYCVSKMKNVEHIDIHILLGLGDYHGNASMEWILDNVQKDYAILLKGGLTKVKSFVGGKQTMFPAELGRHKTFPFNFSDQHVIPGTLGVDGAITRICFESRLITSLFAFLAKTGYFKLLKFRLIKRINKHVLHAFKKGSDIYSLKVETHGQAHNGSKRIEASLIGRREAKGTAMVTAKTARILLNGELNSGVYHSEEVFDLGDYIDDLDGIIFYLDN